MRVLARSVADSARIDSEHSPVREAETRARLAAVIAELSAAVRAYGQLLEAEPVPGSLAEFAAEPITEVLEDHLEEAHRQQDELADLLSTDPASTRRAGSCAARSSRTWTGCAPSSSRSTCRARPRASRTGASGTVVSGTVASGTQSSGTRERHREMRPDRGGGRTGHHPAGAGPADGVPGQGAARAVTGLSVVDGLDVVAVQVAEEHAVVARVVLGPLARGVQHLDPGRHGGLVHGVYRPRGRGP